MFSTVIVPLDGSALAARALPFALRLARSTSGRLVLVRAHVPLDDSLPLELENSGQ
jgi:nucleotide-binding universal stress UspA family protein